MIKCDQAISDRVFSAGSAKHQHEINLGKNSRKYGSKNHDTRVAFNVPPASVKLGKD